MQEYAALFHLSLLFYPASTNAIETFRTMEQSRRECTGNASEYGVPLFMTQAFMLLALNFYQLIFVSVVYQASKFPHGVIYFFLTKLIGGIFAGKKK